MALTKFNKFIRLHVAGKFDQSKTPNYVMSQSASGYFEKNRNSNTEQDGEAPVERYSRTSSGRIQMPGALCIVAKLRYCAFKSPSQRDQAADILFGLHWAPGSQSRS